LVQAENFAGLFLDHGHAGRVAYHLNGVDLG